MAHTELRLEDFEEAQKETEKIEIFNRWEEYNLKELLLRGILAVGYETPSFIQKTAVQPILNGKDIRAQAQSGTGKTGAFVAASLQLIDEDLPAPQVLVLVSTREIANQIRDSFLSIGQFMNVRVLLLCGGHAIEEDRRSLTENPHIIVGTPGRVYGCLNKGYLKPDHIIQLVLDEADEMLKQNFKDQIKDVFGFLPKRTLRIALFSATFGIDELRLSEEMLHEPVLLDLRQEEQTLKGIQQFFINLGTPDRLGRGDLKPKIDTLLDLFKKKRVGQVIVFVSSKEQARIVYQGLRDEDWECELAIGDLEPAERMEIMRRFKGGENRCLVSSGLLQRGIDVPNLSCVFCLDVPRPERRADYIHRIGRSGRYGKRGTAISILYEPELKQLRDIERFYDTEIKELPADFNFEY
jgi:translation initiation factor 4A